MGDECKPNGRNVDKSNLHPKCGFIAKIKSIRSLWRSASKYRVRRVLSLIIRGDFGFLWHQVNRFLMLDKSIQVGGVELEGAMNCLAENYRAPQKLKKRVDLIVPVYNGHEYLESLFSSLSGNTQSSYRLIVIDDASPDLRIWPLLQSLISSETDAILLQNEKNLGFVKTVNRATEYVEGDFVLLNTDIELPPYWLERLMSPICLDRAIACSTPFSNAATICSFPRMNEDNELPLGISFLEIDDYFNMLKPDLPEVSAPTGVGFCMAINGDVWREIGPFDDELFNRGYGEENDWCQRAISKGYRNCIVQNLFVYHKHGGSFDTDTRMALREENYRKLIKRWPKYPSEVNAFIEDDPLKLPRSMAILLTYCNSGSVLPTLIFDHEIGGGANTYRHRLVRDRLVKGGAVFVLTAPQKFTVSETQLILDFYCDDYSQRFEIKKYSILHKLFNVVRLGEIFYNNIVSYQNPLAIVRLMLSLKEATKSQLTLALHDFYMINPSYTLLDAQGEYCGIKEIDRSWKDISKNPFAHNPQNNTIEEWHLEWGALVARADTILCFSENSKKHLVKVYPNCLDYTLVCPHQLPTQFKSKPLLSNNGYLSIAVVGFIGRAKGCKIVAELTELLRKHDKNARLTVIGIMEAAPKSSNLRVTGTYKPDDLPRLLEKYGINVCLLPSVWPETFSYVAEELMALDVPLVCFDLGAPAERVSQYQKGQVASEMSAEGALNAINALLDRLRCQ
ncbi:MAG TPA: glycosyltransferase [Pseudochrobactrum sp.]|nr:glycosyltransferase [Pseudochrobactrum sp.]